MDIPIWQYIVSMSLYICILYFSQDFFRKNVKWASIFFVLTLFTFPLWMKNLDGWFRWGKTFIVLIPTCFTNFVRISNGNEGEKKLNFLKGNWVFVVLYIVLFLNILEASLKDFTLGNYFNFASGIILCLTIPLPKKSWRVDKKEGFSDIVADLPLAWCFLYTTWNACFVYAENASYLASSLCILIVPEIVSIVKGRSDLWLSARIYTLAIHLFIRATFGDIFSPIMGSAHWFNSSIVAIWGTINILIHVIYAAWWFSKKYKERPTSVTA